MNIAYELLVKACHDNNISIPQNQNVGANKDLLLRDLDCAVIQKAHEFAKNVLKIPFDSVRGVFTEGKEMYPGAGIAKKTHTQICIVNPNCIKGYFSPLSLVEDYPLP